MINDRIMFKNYLGGGEQMQSAGHRAERGCSTVRVCELQRTDLLK